MVLQAQNQEYASLLTHSGFNYVGSSRPPLLFAIKWVIVCITISSQAQGRIAATAQENPLLVRSALKRTVAFKTFPK